MIRDFFLLCSSVGVGFFFVSFFLLSDTSFESVALDIIFLFERVLLYRTVGDVLCMLVCLCASDTTMTIIIRNPKLSNTQFISKDMKINAKRTEMGFRYRTLYQNGNGILDIYTILHPADIVINYVGYTETCDLLLVCTNAVMSLVRI